MSDRSINAALFAGLAVTISIVLAIIILKLFNVKKPMDHKYFMYITAGLMLLCYVARAAIR